MNRKYLLIILSLTLAVAAGAVYSFALADAPRENTVYFAENRGQFAEPVRYRSENSANTIWVLDDSIWFTYMASTQAEPGQTIPQTDDREEAQAVNLRLTFPQSSPNTVPTGRERADTARHYLTPDGAFNNVPLWDEIRYENLYVGLDLTIREINGRAALVFETASAMRPTMVEVAIEGASGFEIQGSEVVLRTELGGLVLPMRTNEPGLTVRLTSAEGAKLVFAPKSVNADRADDRPSAGTLIYSSYYGAGGTLEYGSQVVTDDTGAAYIAGGADSVGSFYPETGLFSPLHLVKAFIIKLTPDGTSADYISTISGLDPDGEDFATAIEIDDSGAAYVAGLTSSFDFPATTGAFDESPNGGNDAWFARLDPTGAVNVASVLGTGTNDWANAIGLGLGGEIFVSGFTNGGNFPTTGGAYDTTANGGFDIFVSKFNNAGSTLLAGTYLGGSGDEGGDLSLDRSDLVIDDSGRPYVTGPTESGNFPLTGARIGPGGCKDIYVSRLSASLANLEISNRIGGSGSSCGANGDDNAEKMAVDSSGNIFITGYTSSSNGSFPVTGGAYDTSFNGFFDAFFIKLDPTGTGLLYGTFLGGTNVDVAKDIATDPAGYVYLTGYTYSSGYPVLNPLDPTLSGAIDAFFTKIYPGGNTACDLRYSTFIGGSGLDLGVGIALLGSNDVYITGQTYSNNFPTVPGSFDVTYSGDADAFMLKLELVPPSPVPTWTPAPFNIHLPITSHNPGC